MFVVTICALEGCGKALARNDDDVLRVAFIPPLSNQVEYQERSAIRLAFADANDRRAVGSHRIVLDDEYAPVDLAVIAGAHSIDEDRLGVSAAFISVSLEKSGSSLQLFAARFKAFAGVAPGAQA